jgi:hypothetical protein
MAQQQKMKPPRDYPNMNAIHAIRGQWAVNVAQTNLSLPLLTGVWTQLGTIPANSMITAAEMGVSIAVLPAGSNLDLGFSNDPNTPPGAAAAVQLLDAIGVFPVAKTAPGLGYRADQTVVWGRYRSGGAPLTAGGFTAIVTYYPKQD